MFTSGTTGVPKGVMVNKVQLFVALVTTRVGYEVRTIRHADRQPVLPCVWVHRGHQSLFHSRGRRCCRILPCIRCGLSCRQRIQEIDKVMVFSGSSAIFRGLINCKHIDDYDTSSLRSAVTGAASIPVETVVDMRDRLGFDTVVTAAQDDRNSWPGNHLQPMTRLKLSPPQAVSSYRIDLRLVDDDGNDGRGANPENFGQRICSHARLSERARTNCRDY